MKHLITTLVLVAGLNSAQATTLSFEDLGNGSAPVPVDYCGLDWGSGWNAYSNPQYPYVPNSGSVRIYNTYGQMGVIKFNQVVTVETLWIAGYGYDQYVEGYRNGIKLFESLHMPGDESTFGMSLNMNWSDVDEIRFRSSEAGYNHYVIDDLMFTPSTPCVPDAGGSMSILGGGLLAVAAFRRRLSRVG